MPKIHQLGLSIGGATKTRMTRIVVRHARKELEKISDVKAQHTTCFGLAGSSDGKRARGPR